MEEEQVGIKTPEYVSLQFQLAGLGSRTAAFLIDKTILGVFNLIIILIAVFISVYIPDIQVLLDANSYIFAIMLIVLFLINWGYFFVLEYFYGGKTIGKRIVGIRVIQDNGHGITILSSLLRNLLRIIDSLPTNYILGMVMIFFHSKKKRIGDLVAGTIVVHERKAKLRKKLTPIEKEIQSRGILKTDLPIDEWAKNSIGLKEWNLLRTYMNRFLQIPLSEREQLTKQVAEIIFPKLGIDYMNEESTQLENKLFSIYLQLKDEWEFDQ